MLWDGPIFEPLGAVQLTRAAETVAVVWVLRDVMSSTFSNCSNRHTSVLRRVYCSCCLGDRQVSMGSIHAIKLI